MMRGAAVAVLAAFLFAACVDAPDAGETSERTPARTPSLLTNPPVLIGPGGDAEVSLDVSPDGLTMLACSHGGFTQASPLWASTDAGATWTRIRPEPNTDFTGDCDVSIGADGSWHIIYDTVYSATVASSSDQGATWALNYASAIPFAVVDRPWIHAFDRENIYISYGDLEAVMPAIDTFGVTTDGGLTWRQTNFGRPDPPDRINNIAGDIMVSDDGTIRIPLYRWNGQGGPVYFEFAVSRDGGLLWTTEPVVGPLPGIPLQLPTAAEGPDGTLYLAYSTDDEDGDVLVVYSHDSGVTWSDPMAAATGQHFAGLPTVWVDGRIGGTATIAWLTADDATDPPQWQPAVARIRVTDGFRVEFSGTVGERSNGTALYEFFMVQHDLAGRAVLAYPVNTGPDCHVPGPIPSQAGSGATPRNNVCVYMVKEDPPADAAVDP